MMVLFEQVKALRAENKRLREEETDSLGIAEDEDGEETNKRQRHS